MLPSRAVGSRVPISLPRGADSGAPPGREAPRNEAGVRPDLLRAPETHAAAQGAGHRQSLCGGGVGAAEGPNMSKAAEDTTEADPAGGTSCPPHAACAARDLLPLTASERLSHCWFVCPEELRL